MNKTSTKYCNCLYHSVNALARQMTKIAEEEFAVTGLAPSYVFLLMSINEKPGIQPKELSEWLQLTPSTVTRLVEKMEVRGFVRRKSSGRITEVFPSRKCEEVDAKIKEAWRSLYDRYSRVLGQDTEELTRAVATAVRKLSE